MTPATTAPAQAKPAETKPTSRNPWLWVPSLYFSEGIPYVIVMTMSVVMYKRLGISNTDIALYTSWLYLPWVIKPLWSPFVDITRTKRFWIVAMQFLVSLGLALVAFSVRGSAFFKWSLFLFWIMAFASSTHDIAADGFYMLGLSKHEQAWWVGLRSTFYRTAMIVGSGLLVVLAGVLESKNGLPPVEIPVQAKADAPLVSKWDPAAVKLAAQEGELRVIAQPSPLEIALTERSAEEAKAVISQAKAWNRQHGFVAEDNPAPVKTEAKSTSWWSSHVSGPFGSFLASHFPKTLEQPGGPGRGGGQRRRDLSVAVEGTARPARRSRSTSAGSRAGSNTSVWARATRASACRKASASSSTPTNWNQPAMAVIQLDPKLKSDTGVTFLTSSGNIPVAWSITLFFVAALFLAFSCWHSVMLPRPATDGPVLTHHSLVGEFFATLGSFFQKPGVRDGDGLHSPLPL